MVTTVTNNSPQAINTSLFSLEKITEEKAKLLNERLNEANSAIAEINKILGGINKDAGVVSVNGKQGIVVLDASDIGGLATVATSGNYNDLSNKPTIPAAQVPSDWNATSGVARILNKPSLASVATSGSYDDLSNKPTIPTKTSELTNDSGFVSPQNVLFNDTDVPEGSGNLNTTATAHKITTYRNGLTIPYQMDNTNDGGLLRVRGTSEDNCVLELSTWDDSGTGETIQFNYYPTSSKDTPTHSVSVPKKSGTIALTSDILNYCYPVGVVYVQFPGCDAPGTLFPNTTWTELNFSGAFFRASGGNAKGFNGGLQEQDIQPHKHSILVEYGAIANESYSPQSANYLQVAGVNAGTRSPYADAIELTTGTETRPSNYTIRIWKRTA